MASDSYGTEVKVLVTGFGRYRGFNVNPSWQIASQLPTKLSHRGVNIHLIIPPEPLKAEYHYLIDAIPKLLEKARPNVFVNLGQDEAAKDFMIERGARRDVYFECPDMARKVLTKAETQSLGDGGPERIETGVDVDALLRTWRRNLAESIPRGAPYPGLGVSDDAGNYVCGFAYYTALQYLRKNGNDVTKTVFLHVPPLKSEEELERGREVTKALIKAITEKCEFYR